MTRLSLCPQCNRLVTPPCPYCGAQSRQQAAYNRKLTMLIVCSAIAAFVILILDTIL